ncbi:ribonuclease R [Mesomycoplasma conjunctivae]|uniref:ribonuclease R n=1 Tax=Mesomycoplasma conjunctivae TaxID=45361 RepID=UPI003DA691CE
MFIPDQILCKFLTQPKTFIEITKNFNIPYNKNHTLTNQISKLIENFVVFKLPDGRYHCPVFLESKVGIYRSKQATFGFVEDKDNPQSENNIFVPAKFSANSLEGDEVRVNIYKDSLKPEQKYGVITKILHRNLKFLIGKIVENGTFLDFEPINLNTKVLFRWQNSSMTSSLKSGDFVKVKIVDYQKRILKISLIQKIGHESEHFLNVKIPIIDSGVSTIFNEEVIQESKQIPQEIKSIDPDRIDLRNEVVITIDGDDTKDFDDAISIDTKENNYILKVHIADVSYYVTEDSALDLEAKARGTSIYLPHIVIPMLPESLSNGICSLNPNVDRYTITMEALIDENGQNLSVKIYPSVIRSYKRLTYHQVNEFFDNKLSFGDPKLENLLKNALKLGQILRKYKENQGYVDLEIDESKIILDEQGYTEKIEIKERGLSENIIEDFMVRANENVSKYLADHNFPNLYRVHSKPDSQRILQLNQIIKNLGLEIQIPYNVDSKSFADFVNQIKNKQNDNFIKIAILRTMQKAIYSDVNEGHFGLASKFYSHFTSPIRRYPDLILHRIIRHFIFNKNTDITHFNNILAIEASSTTELEQKAFVLERKIVGIKKAEYINKHIGKSFNAQINSILKFGFFVEIEGIFDALVGVKSLPDNDEDVYNVSEDGFSISNSKFEFKLGQIVNVTITEVDTWNGKVSAKINI